MNRIQFKLPSRLSVPLGEPDLQNSPCQYGSNMGERHRLKQRLIGQRSLQVLLQPVQINLKSIG